MIDLFKTQIAILKQLKKNSTKVIWNIKNDTVFVAYNGLTVYVIPKCQWFLNLPEENRKSFDELFKLDVSNYETGSVTRNLKLHKDKLFVNIDSLSHSVWVSKQEISSFGKNVFLKIYDKKPVFVYSEDGTLLGLTLPMTIN